ncbi:histidine phosphatase family protein [Caballeronia sp. GAWG2-1]|uniref:histidine phosphatase family protein n=1 Tax=Caballeronia sp. GAWG2-1 TaxID=2921744 RepID=UPI0020277C07|nr:histidine phosphatase family protein [Caballeronia sp. GAWG2-1]
MQSTLILLCHAATHAMKSGRFPQGDEPVEQAKCTLDVPGDPSRVTSSPARVACETAAWITTDFSIDVAFDDIDYGEWRGRSIREISEREPQDVAAWLSDPHARPHGGESVAMLSKRVEKALEGLASNTEHECCIVVTHAIVMKAALCIVRDEPLSSILKMDLAPLSSVLLKFAEGKWTYVPS